MKRDCLLQYVQTTFYRPSVTHICRHVHSHSLTQHKTCGWKRNSLNIFKFSIQKHIRNRHFFSWDKIFVDQWYWYRSKACFKLSPLPQIAFTRRNFTVSPYEIPSSNSNRFGFLPPMIHVCARARTHTHTNPYPHTTLFCRMPFSE